MASPGATPDRPTERRSTERARVACPAQLHLTTGVRAGALWDLSTAGARVALDDPPRVGTEVLLKWQSHEAFGRVVWVNDGMCGVTFDRMLPRAMLDEGLLPQEEAARPAGPAAAVGSIPLGRPRFGRRNAGEASTEPVSREVPAASVARQAPATPVAREVPATPIAREAPAARTAQEVPAAPVAREAPAAPVAREVPSEPVAREAPAARIARNMPAAPAPVEPPAEPTPAEPPAVPRSSDTPPAPVSRRAPSDCPFPNWEPPPAPPVATVDSIPLGRRRSRP